MGAVRDIVARLRKAWTTTAASDSSDFQLLDKVGAAFVARSSAGASAVVVPMSAVGAVGRTAAGCELVPHSALRCRFDSKEWTSPAAVLICRDSELTDSFAVLAADVVERTANEPTWQSILAAVEDWQKLLAPRGRPSAEVELGLWGELWFLAQSDDVDRCLEGWRGPEADTTDFLVDGVSVEVKAARARRQHFVSVSQISDADSPLDGWLLSLWVKPDPASLITVPALAAQITNSALDPAQALRRIARAGYVGDDRHEFSTGFVLAAEPEWYPHGSVPRVRSADAGVSHIRYRVLLDESKRAEPEVAARIAAHFHGEIQA